VVDAEYMRSHSLQVGGYYVVYGDGTITRFAPGDSGVLEAGRPTN